MTKGFFTSSKIQSKQIPRISHCGLCGLYKHCKSPKMLPSGKGNKKILVVEGAPSKQEDKVGEYLRSSYLKSLGIDLDLDCIKTNAVICRPKNNKIPNDSMIDICRPNLLKTIKKYKPNVILLLGDAACKSLLPIVWGDSIDQISRWIGFCIPCTDPNAWIIPSYDLPYISKMNDVILNRIFRKHLKLALSKSKSKPWGEIPEYEKKIEVIYKPSQAAKIIKEMIRKGGAVTVDYETNCLKPEGEGTEIVSCSICWRGRRTISYTWHGEAIDATDELLKSSMPKIASNLKMEDRWTRVKLGHPVKNWLWDTMIAAHVLDNRPGITGLKFQSFVLLGAKSYGTHIKPFLQSKKGSRFNRIRELDLSDLLLYGGLDSSLEYWVAMKQMKLMGRMR